MSVNRRAGEVLRASVLPHLGLREGPELAWVLRPVAQASQRLDGAQDGVPGVLRLDVHQALPHPTTRHPSNTASVTGLAPRRHAAPRRRRPPPTPETDTSTAVYSSSGRSSSARGR